MDPDRVKALLEEVQAGSLPVDEALRALRELPFRSLGFAHPDTHRHLRTGFPEVVLGQGKTPEQIAAILSELARGGSTVMATRVDEDTAAHVVAAVSGARYLPVPRAVVVGPMPAPDRGRGPIVVVTAGTSDVPVAEEAALTAELAGNHVNRIYDVGVAGLHRLLAHRDIVEAAEIVIVVAGMEGALPSVVGGLFARPVIAVPTSVGYGASLGGLAALMSMLTSCAAGIAVVNIDNGFGAGHIAAQLNRKRPA
ncbi:MAG TPA: nickel pincer cofactor biosynthesis protein LarB [Polyangia bacterium]|jgi:NCAIR mutase (PurE)-related protein|nr:nickel pincer cofactor biosynthesis protein LarB [Polyangia bacterium]